jgi:hypothetical protein
MAVTTLSCYSAELDGFADLAGDFDFLSTQEREGWLAGQWSRIANAGGWREEFDATVDKLTQSQLGLVSLYQSALAAFTSFIRREREGVARAERATVRSKVLLKIRASASAALWRVETDASSLPSGACYGRAEWQGAAKDVQGVAEKVGDDPQANPAPGDEFKVLPHRAFLSDAGPSYFWTPAPTTLLLNLGCGWDTPFRLSLGTFPWVYGDRLQAPAPGLSWRSNAKDDPAPLALRIAAGMWHPEGNLDTDAREVAAAWKHWRATTAPLVAAMPSWPADNPQPGTVFRDGERLRVFDGDEALAGVNGPRGFICVAAYNFIQGRFAAFFAMRRALLRARKNLAPELRKALIANPDPCVKQQLGVASLTLA